MNSVEVGRKGEKLVLDYYLEKNYTLVVNNFEYRNQNFQGRLGEIDLILEKDNLLVLVEVKFRNNLKFGAPIEQINRSKMEKIFKSYLYFISLKANQKYQKSFARFDVASVFEDKIEVIPNAYSFEGFLGKRF
jgi:putative endonuclease